MTQFANNEALSLVGPFNDSTPHTKKITTQKCIFLPFALVLHVIGRNLTPRAAVQVLVPLMDALELELPQLTQFLLAVCTKTTDNRPPVMIQDQLEVRLIHTQPRMSKVNNTRRTNILHRQFPSLSSSGSDLGSSVAAIQNVATSTEGLRTALNRNMNQRRLDIKEKKKPTSVGDKYPHQLDCILKATGMEREEDLPEIWQQMANWKRDSKPLFSMLQTQVSKEVAYFEQPTIGVTVIHENALKSFTFDGDSIPSNIVSGFLPFMMIPSGGTSNEATAHQLEIEDAMLDYGIVLEGGKGDWAGEFSGDPQYEGVFSIGLGQRYSPVVCLFVRFFCHPWA